MAILSLPQSSKGNHFYKVANKSSHMNYKELNRNKIKLREPLQNINLNTPLPPVIQRRK